MEQHRCTPPSGSEPIHLARWSCPVCGDAWEARLLGPVNAAQGTDPAADPYLTNAEWVRARPGAASPGISVQTFREPEGTELRCSFCWKPRGAVEKLISGPGTGPSRVLICNECVDLCVEIITEERAEIEAEREIPTGNRPADDPATTPE